MRYKALGPKATAEQLDAIERYKEASAAASVEAVSSSVVSSLRPHFDELGKSLAPLIASARGEVLPRGPEQSARARLVELDIAVTRNRAERSTLLKEIASEDAAKRAADRAAKAQEKAEAALQKAHMKAVETARKAEERGGLKSKSTAKAKALATKVSDGRVLMMLGAKPASGRVLASCNAIVGSASSSASSASAAPAAELGNDLNLGDLSSASAAPAADLHDDLNLGDLGVDLSRFMPRRQR
jgi:hypothetical protein